MKIKFKADTKEADASVARARRLKPTGPPLGLDPKTSAVQFLRGVASRSKMSLPAFYLFLGSSVEAPDACSIPGYPGTVMTHWTRFSSANTMTLCCRNIFDNAADGMTGSVFAKSSDSVLEDVAEYWAECAKRTKAEALAALSLLRTLFRKCAQSNGVLLGGEATLGKRIGLLTQHADRHAAHLSLENYEFSIIDCAHVVGALVLVGEIIRTFDDAEAGPSYFNQLDDSSFSAAEVNLSSDSGPSTFLSHQHFGSGTLVLEA